MSVSEVILVNLTNFQEYIIHNIQQLQLLKYKITVIITDNLYDNFKHLSNNVNIILTSQLDDSGFNKKSLLYTSFRNGFLHLCSQRMFYLHSYMKSFNTTNVLHIENDVMLYWNIIIPNPDKIWLVMDSSNRCIPGIMFIPDYSKLDKLILKYNYKENDMVNLSSFFYNNREICETFPIIQKNSFYNNEDMFTINFDRFNDNMKVIYDGAAIGQYLGGVDPRNISGDTRGFINETCVVNYSKYTFQWKFNNELLLFQPIILINNNEVLISNLHIHSKQVHRFMSMNPIEHKYIVRDYLNEFISGEKIQSIANVYAGLIDDFNYNPYIKKQTEKLLNLSSIVSSYDNPYIIFCYGHRLSLLMERIKYFQNPFILISHNSDENIDNRYDELLLSDKIIKWYSQNIKISHPKLHMVPIGIANSMWNHGNMEILKNIITQDLIKTKNVYFYFSISTNSTERNHCKTEIERKGLTWGTCFGFNDYLKELSLYKFAICPPGNGVDCHRIWECYYLGVIPIMVRSQFTEHISKCLPCILLDKWSDFNINDILPLYDSLLVTLNKNYKYITLQYYINEIENKK